jgi:hypothetical protein
MCGNKTVNGKQITICFHVNDCKIPPELSTVVGTTINWLRAEYESIFKDGSGAIYVTRGKKLKYLGMSLYFLYKGQCCVTMYDYLDGILKALNLAVKKHGNGDQTVGNQCSKASEPLYGK